MRKKPLPFLPRTIDRSGRGAKAKRRRASSTHRIAGQRFSIREVAVQGDHCVRGRPSAAELTPWRTDVIVIARGGGAVFDERPPVRAVADACTPSCPPSDTRATLLVGPRRGITASTSTTRRAASSRPCPRTRRVSPVCMRGVGRSPHGGSEAHLVVPDVAAGSPGPGPSTQCAARSARDRAAHVRAPPGVAVPSKPNSVRATLTALSPQALDRGCGCLRRVSYHLLGQVKRVTSSKASSPGRRQGATAPTVPTES